MKQLDVEIIKKSEELDQEDLKQIWQKIKDDRIIFSDLSDIYEFFRLKIKQETQTIWFNAWRHDKSESLWATFALSFLEQLSKNRNLSDFLYNFWSSLILLSYRFNWKEKPLKFIQTLAITSVIVSIIVAIPIVYFKVGFEGVSQLSESLVDIVNLDAKESEKSQKSDGEKTNDEKDKKDNQDSELTDNQDANNLVLNILLFLVRGTGGSIAGIGKLVETLEMPIIGSTITRKSNNYFALK